MSIEPRDVDAQILQTVEMLAIGELVFQFVSFETLAMQNHR